MNTKNNEVKDIVSEFIKDMDDNSEVGYAKLERIWGGETTIRSCSGVTEREIEYAKKGEMAFLTLIKDATEEHSDHLWICLDDGTIYNDRLDLVAIGEGVGKVNKEIVKMLLPIYKKYYLDNAEGYLKARSQFVGVRDGFSVMAKRFGVLPWALDERMDCGGKVRFIKDKSELENRLFHK